MKNLKGGAQDKFFQLAIENQSRWGWSACLSRKIETALEQELVATNEQNADMLAQFQQMQSQKATLEAKFYDMSAKLKAGKDAIVVAEAATSLLRTIQNHTSAD